MASRVAYRMPPYSTEFVQCEPLPLEEVEHSVQWVAPATNARARARAHTHTHTHTHTHNTHTHSLTSAKI